MVEQRLQQSVLDALWEVKFNIATERQRLAIESLANELITSVTFQEIGKDINGYEKVGRVVYGTPSEQNCIRVPVYFVNSDHYLDLEPYEEIWEERNS